ncbi:hypothetical protein [Aureibacillus halotolerans]|uniref:Uncharacterized protein n=1 Tax=Aureibacillus halotolerans TaxID=1508390 RepID=A0A4R6U8Y1_9BACI|nr:hypothetical protein [Aureibacillus halotolerans]TDQ42871.1 hypothetical protein EV213_101301 [Aureibacillus halotolerans]
MTNSYRSANLLIGPVPNKIRHMKVAISLGESYPEFEAKIRDLEKYAPAIQSLSSRFIETENLYKEAFEAMRPTFDMIEATALSYKSTIEGMKPVLDSISEMMDTIRNMMPNMSFIREVLSQVDWDEFQREARIVQAYEEELNEDDIISDQEYEDAKENVFIQLLVFMKLNLVAHHLKNKNVSNAMTILANTTLIIATVSSCVSNANQTTVQHNYYFNESDINNLRIYENCDNGSGTNINNTDNEIKKELHRKLSADPCI